MKNNVQAYSVTGEILTSELGQISTFLSGATSFDVSRTAINVGVSPSLAKIKPAGLRLRMYRPLIVAVCLIALLSSLAAANAEPWERLPDGRVIIDIKGFKFAFPGTGNDLNSIHFNEADRQDRATLRDVLMSPDKNRALFKSRSDINVSIYSGRTGLFFGRFDRNELSGVNFAFDVGENQGNCSSWARTFEKAEALDPKDQKLENGWRESVFTRFSKIYTRDPDSGGDIGKISALYCDIQQYCGSSICLAPKLSFAFKFPSAAHPQSEWVELLNKITDVLTYVLPELPNGKAGRK
jgi:hypothetical protein